MNRLTRLTSEGCCSAIVCIHITVRNQVNYLNYTCNSRMKDKIFFNQAHSDVEWLKFNLLFKSTVWQNRLTFFSSNTICYVSNLYLSLQISVSPSYILFGRSVSPSYNLAELLCQAMLYLTEIFHQITSPLFNDPIE